jgi:hypothetical protein
VVTDDRERIRFVADDELPPGWEWAYVALDDGRDCFFIKQSCVCEETLSEAWTRIGAGRRSTAA